MTKVWAIKGQSGYFSYDELNDNSPVFSYTRADFAPKSELGADEVVRTSKVPALRVGDLGQSEFSVRLYSNLSEPLTYKSTDLRYTNSGGYIAPDPQGSFVLVRLPEPDVGGSLFHSRTEHVFTLDTWIHLPDGVQNETPNTLSPLSLDKFDSQADTETEYAYYGYKKDPDDLLAQLDGFGVDYVYVGFALFFHIEESITIRYE